MQKFGKIMLLLALGLLTVACRGDWGNFFDIY